MSIAAQFEDKIYVFLSKENRDEFIKKPSIYSEPNISLPVKLPPIRKLGEGQTPLTSLPALGYLEQGCARAITGALASLSSSKPKIPWLSVEQSALQGVSYQFRIIDDLAKNI